MNDTQISVSKGHAINDCESDVTFSTAVPNGLLLNGQGVRSPVGSPDS